MKLLNLQLERRFQLPNNSNDRANTSKHKIVGVVEKDHHYVVLFQHGRLVSYDPHSDRISWEHQLNDVVDGEDATSGWFSVESINNNTTIVCLNRNNGAIVSVTSDGVELVGEFDNGIVAAAWSPDRQVLLLVTTTTNDEEDTTCTNNTTVLLTLNEDWQVLNEVELVEAHDTTQPVFVTWRPDGSLFAVSSVERTDGMRKITIFDSTTLTLKGMGRQEDGSGTLVPNLLPTPIAWAGPNCSQVLATMQRKGKQKVLVAFFEPNGLRHRDFVWSSSSEQRDVVGMDWNAESDLLAIASNSKMQLWHRSNYHWYLQREIQFDEDLAISLLKFHSQDPYRLVVALSNGSWRDYSVRWHSSCILTGLSSTALCVDGGDVHLTPLSKALVPPPMSAHCLTLESPVCEVATSQTYSVLRMANGVLAVLSSETNLPNVQGIRGWKAPTVLAISRPEKSSPLANIEISSLRNMVLVETFPNRLKLLGVAWTDTNGEQLVCLQLDWEEPADDDRHLRVSILHAKKLEEPVLAVVPWADSDAGALVELESGMLLEWNSDTVVPSDAEPLLEPCPLIAGLKDPMKVGSSSSHRPLVLGKSARGRFYCHDLLLCDSISSFIVSMSQQYVCYVSAESRCQLRFLPLSQLVDFDPLGGSDEHQALVGYEPRNVERGCRLVAVLKEQPGAVLQMPRGNLEVAYPRALVLRFAMLHILSRKYGEAFEVMRRQKLDLNLIVDIDPVHFLEHQDGAPLLVDQVRNVDYINLFLSSLQNSDCTQERFPVPEWIQSDGKNRTAFDFDSKVNLVCERMRTVLLENERAGQTCSGQTVAEGDFLLPILSTYAKQNPPKLEDALLMIKDAALKNHDSSNNKPPLFADNAQQSIKYLAFLAEYELLFEHALGLYDFDIARAVARNSQMDPKSYLPLLKRFKELPTFYGRYQVDIRLQRYEFALKNLSKSFEENESVGENETGNSLNDCMELVEEKGLHRLGLELFDDSSSVQRIMVSLGDRLMKEGKASTALSIFLSSPQLDIDRALQAAKDARDWRSFFLLLSQKQSDDRPYDQEQLQIRAHEIADRLTEDSAGSKDKRHLLENAARILIDYGSDVGGALDLLLQAESWDEAKRIVTLHNRPDLLHKCLDAAVSYAHITIDDLEQRSETFHNTMSRYLEVLRIRKEAIMAGEAQEDGLADQEETGSLFSAASNLSSTSLSSAASTGSVGSLSSVISARSTSTFTVVGAQESNRHKSKYNLRGAIPKKKKRKNKGRSKRVLPGSHAELVNLVETLQITCADTAFCDTVADTITFLCRNGKLPVARMLFQSYNALGKQTSASLQACAEAARQHKEAHDARLRREGGVPLVTIPIESTVERISHAGFPANIVDFFSLIPE